jgi:hypothetical protein
MARHIASHAVTCDTCDAQPQRKFCPRHMRHTPLEGCDECDGAFPGSGLGKGERRKRDKDSIILLRGVSHFAERIESRRHRERAGQ